MSTMNQANRSVDGFIRKNKKWRRELEALRRIVLDCDLTEQIKWRTPCYTFRGGNVVMIGVFKTYCSLSFLKGTLLKDPDGILDKPGENTRAARLIRFTCVQQITEMEPTLKAYIRRAIDVEKAGLKVDFAQDRELEIPEELQNRLDELPAFKAAFEALTPGRRRGYILHISGAKQSKTRTSRVDRCMPRILEGKGLHD